MKMVSVNVKNSVNRKTVIVSDEKTIREIFEEAGVECTGLISVNGATLTAAELGLPLSDFGVGERASLFACAKLDNAYKIDVLGDTAVITFDFTTEELKAVGGRFTITEGEDNDEVYAVVIGEPTDLTNHCAVVADRPGKAKATIRIPADVEDVAKYLMGKYDIALEMFDVLEDRDDGVSANAVMTRENIEALRRKINVID